MTLRGPKERKTRALHRRLVSPRGQAGAVELVVGCFAIGKGLATVAARLLGIEHRTLMRWLATIPELREAVEPVRERWGVRERYPQFRTGTPKPPAK